MRIRDVVAVNVVVGSGISAGGLLMFGVGVLPTMRRLPVTDYAVIHKGVDPDIERYMPWVGRATFGTGIALAALQDQAAPRLSAIAGVACMAAVVVISETVNVPINKMVVEDWQVEALPADVAEIRERWTRFHAARTVAALGALVAFSISAVTGG